MSPSAEPAASVGAEALVPQRVLQDGEVVILAVKPSPWFVLEVSWPVVVIAALAAAAVLLGLRIFGSVVSRQTVLGICVTIGCVRLFVGCFQWMARLYVLTNHRVIRIRGVVRENVFSCPLKRLRKACLSTTLFERMVGVGSLLLMTVESEYPAAEWSCVARPAEVERVVNKAIRRAQR